MPRTARLVVEGIPHHVVQRGHNRKAVFVEEDYHYYLNLYIELNPVKAAMVNSEKINLPPFFVFATNVVNAILGPNDGTKLE